MRRIHADIGDLWVPATEPAEIWQSYEPWFCTVIDQLPPRALFLDVGAQYGYFASRAAQRGLRVIAIEANPHIFPYLARNASDYGFCAVHAAAARETGWLDFHYGPGAPGGGRAFSSSYSHAIEKREVRAVALDDLLGPHDEPAAIKIDVEGYEDEVLVGATRITATCLVLLEVHAIYLRERERWDAFRDELTARWDFLPGGLSALPPDGVYHIVLRRR